MDADQSQVRADGPITFMVSGMTCGGCVRSVTRVLSAVSGVSGVEVDLAQGRVVVGGTALLQTLAKAIENQGYGVRLESGGR